jgi:hypothetical protein
VEPHVFGDQDVVTDDPGAFEGDLFPVHGKRERLTPHWGRYDVGIDDRDGWGRVCGWSWVRCRRLGGRGGTVNRLNTGFRRGGGCVWGRGGRLSLGIHVVHDLGQLGHQVLALRVY